MLLLMFYFGYANRNALRDRGIHRTIRGIFFASELTFIRTYLNYNVNKT